jgi:hypothetical protein
MSQAIFDEILVDVSGLGVQARMAQRFAAFHDEELRA